MVFEQNQGAAISLDFDSSPSGIGLRAVGNSMNGIQIPSGTITGYMRWGLVGIPYVVADGMLNIGELPMTLTPTAVTLGEGEQVTFTLRLAKPAPAGGLVLDLVSSVPGVATVPSTLIVPAGAQQRTFTATSLLAGQTTVTVSRLELGAVSAAVTVRPLITLNITPAVASLAVGQSATFTLQLSDPAPPGGVNVLLSSSATAIASVPFQRSISAGFSSQTFSAQGNALGTATITASGSGLVTATAIAQVRAAFLNFVPTGNLPPSSSRIATITLSDPAPLGGRTITLLSSQPSVVSLPPTVFVSAGQSSVTVLIRARVEGTATLTATTPSYDPASISIVVTQSRLLFDPDTAQIPVGSSDRFVVRANRIAPPAGLVVALSSNMPSVGVAPSEIVIPAGQTASQISVVVTGLQEGASAVVKAEAVGVISGTLSVAVSAPLTLRLVPATIEMARDTRTSAQINVRSANGTPYVDREPLLISLASTDPARLAVPASVTVPAGASSTGIYLSALDLGTATVTAVAEGISNPATLGITISALEITIEALDLVRTIGAIRDDFYVRLGGPGNYTPLLAARDIVVNLSVTDTNPAGVVSGMFDAVSGGSTLSSLIIPAGIPHSLTDTGGGIAFVDTPTLTGSYRIAAQFEGNAPSVVSDK